VPFTINGIPFGGFVRMSGEEAPENEAGSKKGMFYAAPIAQRLVVILAGASVNFIFGVLAFTIIYSFMGIPTLLSGARIGYVLPDSPAAESGIPTNVNILKIVGTEGEVAVSSSQDVIAFVEKHRGQTVTVFTTGACTNETCQENLQEFTTYLRTVAETPAGEGALGIAFQSHILQFYPWWQMPFRGAAFGMSEALNLGSTILSALRSLGANLFTQGTLPSELAGPVGIVHQAHTVGLIGLGIPAIVAFAGQLSINLAIMNILPIPPLDGGKAVFTILEAVISRKRLHRFEYLINYVGYIFLLGLIIVVTIRDVGRWVFP
jgi:regulator of sigma E protease